MIPSSRLTAGAFFVMFNRDKTCYIIGDNENRYQWGRWGKMELVMISGVLALLSGGTVFLAQQMRTRPTR